MNPIRKDAIVALRHTNGTTARGRVISAPSLCLHAAVLIDGKRRPVVFDSMTRESVREDAGWTITEVCRKLQTA